MADTWRLSADGYLVYNNKKIDFGELVKKGVGKVTDIAGNSVNIYVQLAEDTTHVNGTPAEDMVTKDNVSVLLPVTVTPIISGPVNVNEYSSNDFIIENYDSNVSYILTSVSGVVSNVSTGGVFTYVAPGLPTEDDGGDVIEIYATSMGKVRSNTVRLELGIVNVPVEGDQTLANADFRTNEVLNENFEY